MKRIRPYLTITIILLLNAFIMHACLYHSIISEKYMILIAIILLGLSLFGYIETERRIGGVPNFFLHFSVSITALVQLLGVLIVICF